MNLAGMVFSLHACFLACLRLKDGPSTLPPTPSSLPFSLFISFICLVLIETGDPNSLGMT